ncbi:MAG: ROK family protein [Limnochordia bacterium]|nr:ROK family transcriptional regulator [Bacillota bacterium]
MTNQSRLLRVLCQKPATRSELAKLTGLSPATVTNLTKELIAQGLVDESRTLESVGGRPPVLLEFNSNAGKVIGVRISRTRVQAALVNLGADALAWEEQRLPEHSPEAVLQVVVDVVRKLCVENRVHLEELVGIGVAVPGIVQEDTGVVRLSTFLQWREVSVGSQLEAALGVPVLVQRNGNASALAECHLNGEQTATDLLYVHLGDGIGAGLVLDGRIYSGRTGRAGEIGHNIVDPHGPQCLCGNRGCLEVLVSGNALARQGQELAASGRSSCLQEAAKEAEITAAVVIAAAVQGDAAARELVATAGRYIGKAMAGIVNLLDMDEVVLGGDLLEAGDVLLDSLSLSFYGALLPFRVPEVRLRVTTIGPKAGVLGAATVVIQQFLSKGGRY